MVVLESKFYTVSTMLFHKDRRTNFEVAKFVSHFSMSLTTKVNIKLANGKRGEAQEIVF